MDRETNALKCNIAAFIPDDFFNGSARKPRRIMRNR